MFEFSSKVLRVFIMTINNKSERNYRGKCLGSLVTSYGGASNLYTMLHSQCLFRSEFKVSHQWLIRTMVFHHNNTAVIFLSR